MFSEGLKVWRVLVLVLVWVCVWVCECEWVDGQQSVVNGQQEEAVDTHLQR